MLRSILIIILFYNVQIGISQTQHALLIDSNQFGKLILENDSIYWLDAQRMGEKPFKFDKKLSTHWTGLKLWKDQILFCRNNCLCRIDVHSGRIDTVFYQSGISYIDEIRMKDSLIATMGDRIVLFNLSNDSLLFVTETNWTQPNMLIGDEYVLMISSPDSIQQEEMTDMIQQIVSFDFESNRFTHITKIENVDNIFPHEYGDWTGMYVHNDLLFIQFIQKLVVVDLVKNRVINETNLLDESTTIELIKSAQAIRFKNRSTDAVVTYLVKENRFK